MHTGACPARPVPAHPERERGRNLAVLPNLGGTDSLPDLGTAMYFDPVLKAIVEDAFALAA